MTILRRQPRRHDRINHALRRHIRHSTAGGKIRRCAPGDVEREPVEDALGTYDVGGESWDDVEDTVVDEGVVFGVCCHLELAISLNYARRKKCAYSQLSWS